MTLLGTASAGFLTPTINWENPENITYGTALSSNQLNASASYLLTPLLGTFNYDPAEGTILRVGTHSLDVYFEPLNLGIYLSVSKNVIINVTQATPTITCNNPENITYGTALSSTQLNAEANVAGTFTYDPATGTVLPVGTHTLNISFVPLDLLNFTNVSQTIAINITKATPVFTCNNPENVTYGTAINTSQLNASAWLGLELLPGPFTYDPLDGTVLGVGTHTLNISFVPLDLLNFTNVSLTITINVTQTTPTITCNNPENITYGTALNTSQLNASAWLGLELLPGTCTYDPLDNTVLG